MKKGIAFLIISTIFYFVFLYMRDTLGFENSILSILSAMNAWILIIVYDTKKAG